MKQHSLPLVAVTAIILCLPVQGMAQTLPSFYVRGDIGWSGSSTADIHDRPTATVNPLIVDNAIVGANGARGSLDNIGDALFVGAGVGMQFTPFLRGDIVYTYRGNYHLDETDHAGTIFKSNIFSNSVMANGYFDYPVSGVIPYLGVGIGWAETQMSTLSATSTLTVNPLATITTGSSTAVAPGGSSDNFAWQVMVGVGIPVAEGVVFDAFYRYFDGGTLRTNSGTVTINGTAVGTYAGVQGSLHANELGVSVRFAL